MGSNQNWRKEKSSHILFWTSGLTRYICILMYNMYNMRRTHKNLTFGRSFSLIWCCLVESLSVDWLLSSPYAGQRREFKLLTLCQIESSSETIFLEVHRVNHKFSVWLWKEILPFDSKKTNPQISHSIGWSCMQSQSLPLRFCGCCSPEQHNNFLPYWIERLTYFAKT